MGGLKSYQLKKLQCLSPYSTSPFYPGGLQWAKNAQKGEIENRPWPYFFSQLDPMLFRIFSLKLIKETPCGHQPVNSNFEFYHPPLPQTSGCCSVEADEREPNSLRTLPHSLFCAPPDPHIGRLSIGPFHPTKPILIYALSYKLPPIRRSQQQDLSSGH